MEHLNPNIKCVSLEDDWRLQNQENYLKGKTFYWRNYSERSQINDHDHCDFCTDEISDLPDTWHAAYSLLDEPHSAVCQKCYEDFKEIFHWKAMTRDHFIHVIKPRIMSTIEFNDDYIKMLELSKKYPLITMSWNGDFLIEFGIGKNALILETGINVNDYEDAINEVN